MPRSKTPFTACVIGLGRAGLPHALVEAASGNIVWGFDRDKQVIRQLESKQVPFFELGLDELLTRTHYKTFFPTSNLNRALTKSDIVVIVVSTDPLQGLEHPDFSNLFDIIDQLAKNDIRGKTIILRSTLAIGTTDIVRERLEQGSGLKCNLNFHVVYCPERLAEGRAIQEERETPKIIGVYCDEAYEISKRYFQNISPTIIRVSSARTAELVKLIDNSYRSTIFAFANDIALISEYLNINAIEAIQTANSNYPRNNIPLPSSGVSGYCLTKDPYILESSFESIRKARGFGSVWYYGRLANDYMPHHVANTLLKLLQTYKKGESCRGLICGITYKENVDDFKFSHGLQICDYLVKEKIVSQLSIYDPYVDGKQLLARMPAQIKDSVSVSSNIDAAFNGQDFVIFLVKHDEFVNLKGERIMALLSTMNEPKIFIDGWNIFPELREVPGIIYRGVGNA